MRSGPPSFYDELPEPGHRVRSKLSVGRYDGEVFFERLADQESIERVTVMKRKIFDRRDVTGGNAKPRESGQPKLLLEPCCGIGAEA